MGSTDSVERPMPAAPVRHLRRPTRSGLELLAALAACWLLPLITHLLRVDLLLVPVIALGAMSLLRGGRTILDQIMVGAAALFGATCLAGIVFSVWPGHLNPVPVAGTGLTILVVLAALTGRRPQLRRGDFGSADGALVGASLVLVGMIFKPFLRSFVDRFGIVAPGEDFARHFIIYDTIRNVGGYTFMHPSSASRFMETGYGLASYPQGWHFVAALLRNFGLSSTVIGPAVPDMSWLVWAFVGTFAFMGVAILWSIRRVAGPDLSLFGAVVVFAIAIAYVYFADPVEILLRGYPNELMGLGLLAMVVALAARPLHELRDQVVVLALLLVGVAFSYYLFLPAAGVAVLIWLVLSRQQLRGHRATLAAGGVLGLGAAVPLAVNMRANNAAQLLLTGQVAAVDRRLLLALLLAVVAGLAAGGRLRSRENLTLIATLAASVLMIVAIGVYQNMTVGHTVYYYEKAYHGLLLVGLVGLGTVPRLLTGWREKLASPLSGRMAAVVPVLLVVFAGVALVGSWTGPRSQRTSDGLELLLGRLTGSREGAADAIAITERYPGGGGAVNVDLAHHPYADFHGTLYGAVMQRDYRTAVYWYVWLAPWTKHTLADMETLIQDTPGKIRFLVSSSPRANLVTDTGNAATPIVPGCDSAGCVSVGSRPSNIEVAEYLAARYPDKVEVVAFPSG